MSSLWGMPYGTNNNKKSIDQQAQDLMTEPSDSTYVAPPLAQANLGPLNFGDYMTTPFVEDDSMLGLANTAANIYKQSQQNQNTNPPIDYSGESIDLSFDMNDPESVKQLQLNLGVTPDGMFGPKTEAAYRAAVNKQRVEYGDDPYVYNASGSAPQQAKPKGGGLMGMLGRAYNFTDKNIFRGMLPGGKYGNEVVER